MMKKQALIDDRNSSLVIGRSAGEFFFINFWQPARQISLDRPKLRFGREIRPFIRIVAMIVKFFAPIGVVNVTPLLRTNGVIVPVKSRDARCGPLGGRV